MSSAALLASSVNIYHPAHTVNTAIDTLFVVIGCIVALTLMVVPAAMARANEDKRLAEEHPPADAEHEATPVAG